MPMTQAHKFCKVCNKKSLHAKNYFGFGWGCLLTIITVGLFLPFWLLADVLGAFRPWRCQTCGKARHF